MIHLRVKGTFQANLFPITNNTLLMETNTFQIYFVNTLNIIKQSDKHSEIFIITHGNMDFLQIREFL